MTIQPLHDQQWANATVYPSGSDSFTGLANKIKPADAEVARGVVPGKRIGAQWENYWKNQVDVSLDSVMDAPALNYGRQQTLLTATALYRASSKLVAVRAVPAGESFPRDYLAFADTQAGVWGQAEGADATTWVDGTSPAFGGPSSNLCAGYLASVPQILLVPIGSVISGLVAGNFAAKKIAAVAGAWSSAGTIDATSGASALALPLYSNLGGVDRFHYPGHNRVNTSSDLVTWASGSTGGAGSTYGANGAASSDGVVYCTVDISGTTPTTEQWYSSDGTTWTRLTGGPALSAVDFSESHQEWIGIAGSHIWTRPAGMSGSWTDRGDPGFGALVAARAFGRCYVVISSLGLFVSHTAVGPWVARMRPRTAGGFTDLIVSAGQLVLAEYESPAGVSQHHTYRSLCAPWLVF